MLELLPFFNVFKLFLTLFLSKIFSSDTTGPIGNKLGINVPWNIMQKTDMGIFHLPKNMATIIKIEHLGQTEVFPIYLQNS